MLQLTIDRRFCGPPNSGNGGYVCGVLGRHVGGCAEVTLRSPPRLEIPLELQQDESGATSLLDGDTVVAVARPMFHEIEAPPFVPFDDAKAASARPSVAPEKHLLPTCFVCGPKREEGDGMRLFAGPVESDDSILAAPWLPDERLPHKDGRPREEFLWAALDCPTGYAAYAAFPQTMLLGRMLARVYVLPSLGEKCVVTAKVTERDGRKIFVNGALYGDDARLLAVARNTWIIVPPEVHKGAV